TNNPIRYSEALGLARLETYTDRLVSKPFDLSHEAFDAGFLKRIQLKGPLVSSKTRQLVVNEDNIKGLYAQVRDTAKGKSCYETIVVDLLGFTETQRNVFREGLEREVPGAPIQYIW